MKVTRTLLEGAAGTTAMTMFSHMLSRKMQENYSEPELLGELVRRGVPGLRKEHARKAGWALHYAIGLGMMAGFRAVAKRGGLAKPLVFGIVGGIAGIAAWRQMFRKHPSPPPADLVGFLTQLLPAHMVFCLPLLFEHTDEKEKRG
ncbi:hypothetical protein MKQ68_11010 [Chitinophaga horti]|uniref:DUF1440 domain-containing protein n=1 Tax=Chitinophaga horti TaxID=2920382 RepID=A0ABY6J7H6_9BACT|nr:hypothetical protein [Chitinophaga horti]UYQ95631.1 hypothetical protein MKQ68_11010 [Chitinophaga horti]